MPLYTNIADVKLRLAGKIRFTDDASDDSGKMPTPLLKKLIEDAEAQVQQDLAVRYATPFQTVDGTAFKNLPPHPTKRIIQTLCELMSVVRALETDFGSGSATEGSKYAKDSQRRYDVIKNGLVGRHDDEKGAQTRYGAWVQPPLESMRLALGNEEADAGFAGAVLSSSSQIPDSSFPAAQITNPARTWWNPKGNEPDCD